MDLERAARSDRDGKLAEMTGAFHGAVYDDVVAAIKACHVKLHDMGAPRIATNIKLGSRTDRAQNMGDRVTSVLEKLDS